MSTIDRVRPKIERFRRSGLLTRAGEAVAPGDGYFREILDALPAAIYITDANGSITYYNEAAAALWGRHPEIGKSQWCGSWKLYWPDGRVLPHDQGPMAVALREKRAIRGMEAAAKRPDGRLVPFIPYSTPLYDSSGELIGAVNMLVDISDRKRAEEYARRLASIVESSQDSIISMDLSGIITSWNQGAERLFGYTAEEAIGKTVTILMPPERQNEEPQIFSRIKSGEPIDHYDTVIRRKDGRRVDISLTVSPIQSTDGAIIGASQIAHDITERRQAEQAAQRLAAIVEFSDDAILTKDLDGVITSWNKGAERLFGYTSNEAIGKSVTMLVPDDHLDEEPMILGRIRSGERIDHYETIRRRKDGNLVDISLTVSPIRNSDGRIIGASKIARDITERRRAREQQELLLREMNHRVKNLFSLASSLVSLSAGFAQTPKELAALVGGRLAALARAHALTLVRTSDATNGLDHRATLHVLIRTITSPYDDRPGEGAERVSVGGTDIPLSAGSVTSLALLLHEFATNAAKYGALSTSNGHVDIQCREEAADIVLTWKERGGPPIDHRTEGEGFGSFLSRAAVTGQLNGTISYDWAPEGLTIRLSVARDRLTGEATTVVS